MNFFPVPPQIAPFNFGTEAINSGDMLSILCVVHKGDLPINITWTLNGKRIDNFVGISAMQMNKRTSQLSIDSVSADLAGKYTCSAKNPVGIVEFSSVLRVNGMIIIS